MINPRLFEHYGIDTHKDLGISKKCPRPFDTILIDKQGSCYACECTSWLPQSVGNLQLKSMREIIASSTATTLRESISDGSYRFCNTKQCLYLHDLKRVPWGESEHKVQLREIRLAVDDSCNLSCPSCRTTKIFVKSGSRLTTRFRLVDKVITYIEKDHGKAPLNLHIGSDGDPFASLVYRYFMRQVPDLDNLTYTMQTNGLLIKQMYHRVKHIFDKLNTLNISIDGATPHTYEKLRRGGNFQKLKENLSFVTEIRKAHNFKLNLHMVVQRDNWQEMPAMASLAHEHSADTVYFNPIQDWNTVDNFDKISVPEHEDEFKRIMVSLKKDPIVNAW